MLQDRFLISFITIFNFSAPGAYAGESVNIMAKKTVKDDVFGYIVSTNKKTNKDGSLHFGYLVQKVGSKEKPAWYNGYAKTTKQEAFYDSFHKGQLVGINLMDKKDFNDILNMHNASKAKKQEAPAQA